VQDGPSSDTFPLESGVVQISFLEQVSRFDIHRRLKFSRGVVVSHLGKRQVAGGTFYSSPRSAVLGGVLPVSARAVRRSRYRAMDFLPGVRLERPTPDENPTAAHGSARTCFWAKGALGWPAQLVWPGVWPDPMNPFKGMVWGFQAGRWISLVNIPLDSLEIASPNSGVGAKQGSNLGHPWLKRGVQDRHWPFISCGLP
jgi:hypothetical protein